MLRYGILYKRTASKGRKLEQNGGDDWIVKLEHMWIN